MMSMGGGGGGGGGVPQNFLPPDQPKAAENWWNTINPLVDAASNGGINTPAGQNYPTAQSFLSRFLTGAGDTSGTFNDLSTRAFGPAYTAANYAATDLYPRGVAQGDTLNQLGGAGVPYAQQALTQGFDPYYGLDSPAFQHQLVASNEAATMGGEGAFGLQNMGKQLHGAVKPLLTAGFDPRSALFNRSRDQLMDQTAATNAMSGLSGSPYGASVQANALGDFDINWQNQQLARQAQATEAARGAAGSAGALYGAAPALAATSAGLPNQAILGQLGARNQGATSGLSNYGAGANTIGSLFSGAQNAGTQAAQTGMQFGAAPYNLGTGMANNALSGLTSATNLGQQQYKLPLDVLGKFSEYMGLGQDASKLAGVLQGQNFNQTASGIGGLLGGLGSAGSMLFGPAQAGGLIGKMSDRRLKTGIKRVGTLDNGLPVYLYRYKDDPTPHIGLMADEVERVHPEAVIERDDGFKAVYYDRAVL